MNGICFSVPHTHVAVFPPCDIDGLPKTIEALPTRTALATEGGVALMRSALDRYTLYPCGADGQPQRANPIAEGLRRPHVCVPNCVVFGLSGGPRIVLALDGFPSDTKQADLDAPGFLGGTRVLGRSGIMSIEQMTSGDLIWTMNHGMQPIRWIARKKLTITAQTEQMRPLLIEKDSFERGCPTDALLVLPNHLIGTEEMPLDLAPLPAAPCVTAQHLLDGERVRRVTEQDSFELFEIGLDVSDMIYASGLMMQNAHSRARQNEPLPSASVRQFKRYFPDLSDLFQQNRDPSIDQVIPQRYGTA